MNDAFEKAMRETWQMIDPLHPSGQPGSYARGEYNGIVAALRTIRENYDRAAKESTQAGPVSVDCIGLALDLESRAEKVDSQTTERAMRAAANGLRLLHQPPEGQHLDCEHGCSHPARSWAGPCQERCVKTPEFHEESGKAAKASQLRFATQIGANVLKAAPAAIGEPPGEPSRKEPK